MKKGGVIIFLRFVTYGGTENEKLRFFAFCMGEHPLPLLSKCMLKKGHVKSNYSNKISIKNKTKIVYIILCNRCDHLDETNLDILHQ